MKNKKIIQLVSFVALALFASSSVQASEVIGILSSGVQAGTSGVIGGSVNSTGGSQVTGNFGNGNVAGNNGSIGGTVTGGVSSGGTGGGGGGIGVPVNFGPTVLGASVSPLAVNNTGTPTVLGASTVGFPDTGFPAKEQNTPWLAILSFGMLIMASHLLFRFLEKRTT